MTNILRDLDQDAKMGRLYLPKEVLAGAGIANGDVGKVLAHPRLGEACAAVVARAERHFAEASAGMARCRRRNGRSPRIMASVYRALLEELVTRGWEPPRPERAHQQVCAAGAPNAPEGPRSSSSHRSLRGVQVHPQPRH